jgi:drug/metabolite transporter (DMT)-like permease
VLAITGGLGAALLFAASTVCSSRSARMIGPASMLAWLMVVGLVAVTPALVATGPPDLDLSRSPCSPSAAPVTPSGCC